MRLIDADAMKNHYSWWGDTEQRRTFDAIADVQPTVTDVVPWEALMRYADLFCALGPYTEFVRAARQFYESTNSAMDGGHIEDEQVD